MALICMSSLMNTEKESCKHFRILNILYFAPLEFIGAVENLKSPDAVIVEDKHEGRKRKRNA